MSFTSLQLAGDDNISVARPPKAKGRAIQGLDYGLDMVNEKPKELNASAPKIEAPSSPSPNPNPFQARQLPSPPAQAQSSGQMMDMDFSVDQPASPSYGNGGMRYDAGSDLQSNGSVMSQPGFAPSGMGQQQSMMSASQGAGFHPQQSMMSQGGLVQPGMFASSPAFQAPQLSYEQIRQKKIDLMADYRRLKDAGYAPAGDMDLTMSSDLEDMTQMVDRMKAQRDLDNSIKWQRKMLVGFATLTENVLSNKRWNIFDLRLKGWSENVYDNITDYDDVFEELHHKYKSSVQTPPELRLIGMVVGSAWMYHMSHDIFKKTANVPGFNDVMSQNPNLRQQYENAAVNMTNQSMPNTPVVNMMQNMAQQTQQQRTARTAAAPAQPRQPDPEDVDDLLSSLTGGDAGGEYYDDDELDLSEIEELSELA